MKPRELQEIRESFGMTRNQFGRVILGYTGESRNIWNTVKRYESNGRPIPPLVQRLVRLLVWHKSDFGYLPDLDRDGARVPLKMPSEFIE